MLSLALMAKNRSSRLTLAPTRSEAVRKGEPVLGQEQQQGSEVNPGDLSGFNV